MTNFGGLESPSDHRDFKPEELLGKSGATPESFSCDIAEVPVYMQAKQPACGGHAGTVLFQALAQNGEILSPRFVYALCKKIDGLPDQQGTTARAILQVLQRYGICNDALFPNDTSLSYEQYADYTLIPNAAYVDALQRRIGAYARLENPTYQTIKDSIYQNNVVLILGQIGNEWWTPSWAAKDILPLKPPAQVVSGHFWVNYGFDTSTTILRNSWSNHWANTGNGEYAIDYQPFIKEAWIAQLAPKALRDIQTKLTAIQKVVNLIKQLYDKSI